MWMTIQITVCVIFLLIICFFAGKKLGQRRFLKIQEEMRALELSFNQLLEEMELVSSHNMKVLEGQTNDLKELLTIADKKCLYANDLLKSIDDGADSLKKSNFGLGKVEPKPQAAEIDKEFKSDVFRGLEELHERLAKLEKSFKQYENKHEGFSESVRESIQSEISALKVYTERRITETAQEVEEAVLKAPIDRFSQASATGGKRLSSFGFSGVSSPALSSERPPEENTNKFLKAAEIDSLQPRFPTKKVESESSQVVPIPPPGSPVHEILLLVEQGMSLPQIARKLSMSKGEIDLVLKIYAPTVKMRNVI